MRMQKLMSELKVGDKFFETETSTEELMKVVFCGRETDDFRYNYCFSVTTNDVDYYYSNNQVWTQE